ncbi:3-hydroxyacyl-CoA dehydrogenase NAD-binding domain-containing protein [Streptomyces sp. NPDC050263]|uniref:3-hydroxyacyl-CoA dehydrogenase NAD-binding domain-containing protein n=1 Tax=Streptomyces sp. NPDC050263 TaxID=3155037 RepID=UPI00343EBC2B
MNSTIRWEQDADGVVVLTLDHPEQSANTMTEAYAASMRAAVDRLEAERESVSGVIVTSAKKTFFAGGDLNDMLATGPGQAAAFFAFIEGVKADLRRLETLGRPVVAAINGAALGGGLEIALACHHRVALDVKGSTIGLPEATLGLLPGAGGVTRTVRMLGVTRALESILLDGRTFTPAAAVDSGLVDELAATHDELLAAARAWITAHPDAVQPWDGKAFKLPGGTPAAGPLAAVLPSLPATLRAKVRGANLPAPRAILAAAVEGAQVDIDTALTIESRYLTKLVTGQVSKNMIKGFFFDMQHIEAGGSRPEGPARATVRKAVVIGAGMMGAGIAYACARAGIEVVLQDVTAEAAAQGKDSSRRLLDREVARGRTSRAEADRLLARIRPTADASDAVGADLVIEAVFEDPALKKRILGEIEAVVAPDALLASNTSTLPITDLAQGVDRPADFIGLHFFSPVDRMRLVEIVVGEKTGDTALARAVDFTRQIGRTPVVVGDGRGFFTTRVIRTFLDEAAAMVGEGIAPATVEQAGLQAGYPSAPLRLWDELTLTLMRRIREETRAAVLAEGGAWEAHGSEAVVDRLVGEFDRAGRSTGGGFYEYDADGRRTRLWPGLTEHFGRGGERAQDVRFEDLKERMLFAEALESVRCVEDGVLRSVPDANVGSLLGIGFPAWTGGVLQYVNGYEGGLPAFAARARELADRYGPRFEPPALLLAKAAAREIFA